MASAEPTAAAQKREQAEEAVRRAEAAGHKFRDQPMRAESAASSYDPLDARLGRTSGEPVETTKGKPVRSHPARKQSAARTCYRVVWGLGRYEDFATAAAADARADEIHKEMVETWPLLAGTNDGSLPRVRNLDSSPFEMPTLECRDCGRTDEHTYCDRWMERLHLWLTRRRRAR